MNAKQRLLRRQQLDRQLMPLASALPDAPPSGGWIRAVREALGMSLAAFAGRLGLASSSTAHQIEQAEVQGTISVRRLRAAANALGCDLAVVLVPRKPLARQVEERAREVAAAQLARAGHSMQLEQQGVDAEQFEVLLKVAADELLRGPGARLWDEV